MDPNWTHAEGFVLGGCAKMFTIAGSVIVYGVSASVVYGVIYLDNNIVFMDGYRSPLRSDQNSFSLFAVQTVTKYAPGVE